MSRVRAVFVALSIVFAVASCAGSGSNTLPKISTVSYAGKGQSAMPSAAKRRDGVSPNIVVAPDSGCDDSSDGGSQPCDDSSGGDSIDAYDAEDQIDTLDYVDYADRGADGGSVPTPPPAPRYGTQGSCATGYLYFSDGCEDNGTNLSAYPGWQSWATFSWAGSYAFLKFNDSHFWPQHLACYLRGSTNEQVDQAITDNFDIYHYEKPGDPVVGSAGADFTFTYTDTVVGAKTIEYHIYHYGKYPLGVATVDLYVVGTAFIPLFPNCP